MAAPIGTNRSSLTTRMPNGVTNAAPWQTMGNAGTLDPTWSNMFATDFDTYAAADWTLTGTGTPAAALVAGDGGLLQLSTTAGIADTAILQKTPAAFTLPTNGKGLFMKYKSLAASLTAVGIYAGLVAAGSTTAATIQDGIYLVRAAGSTVLNLGIAVGGVRNLYPLPTNLTVAPGTPLEVGIAIDPAGNVLVFYNPTTGGNPISAANAAAGQSRGPVLTVAQPTLSTANLTPTVAMFNSTAVAANTQIDFLVVSKER